MHIYWNPTGDFWYQKAGRITRALVNWWLDAEKTLFAFGK